MKTLNELLVEYSSGTITSKQIKENYGNLSELIDMYFNDKNSSTLRQMVSCELAGLKTNPNKLGYDSVGTNDEIKPQNTQSKSKKLNGGGNYTDLTHKRHEKYVLDDVKIHSSGFVNGQLIFMIKIPYVELQSHFKNILNEKLPNGDEKNRYVRTAQFSYTHYKNCQNVEVEFVREDIYTFKEYINKDLFNFLSNVRNNNQ